MDKEQHLDNDTRIGALCEVVDQVVLALAAQVVVTCKWHVVCEGGG